jgi:diguanylate cyclase (GGDEF)-like protein/PAS domain S-box-containing protein
MLLWVAGDVTYGLAPDGSILPDLAYVPAYLALIAAMIVILRARVRHSQSDSAIDAAMVGVAGLLAVWELIIEPGWEAEGIDAVGRTLAAVYPVLDVVLLVLLVQLMLVPGRRLAAMLWLGAGVTATFAADVVYAVLQQTDSYVDSVYLARVLDSTWLIGYALFAVAAWHPSMTEVSLPIRAEPRFGSGRLLAAGTALLAVPLTHVLSNELNQGSGVETLVLSSVTIVPLVVWRIARLNRSTQRGLDEVARREAYYRGVAVNSSDAFVLVDEDGVVLDASDALEQLVQISASDALQSDVLLIVHPGDRSLAEALLADARTKPGVTLSSEVRARTADRRTIWMQLRITNLISDPQIGGIVINAHDITARKHAEEELSHQAFHDSLTGLANRSLVQDRVRHALLRRAGDHDVSVVFCDLDGFKSVNDTLGHDAGDAVLQVVAQRLAQVVRPADTVARMGGDEFVILLESSVDEAGAIAERMLQVIADPIAVDGTPLVVTGSLGLASASVGGQTTADDLLRDADTAMYEAKAAGRNRVVVYDPGMRQAALERLALEADLHGALDRGELEARYQPVVSLHDGRVVGFEALIRWNHPERGLLLPEDFVWLAEESGDIISIGAWMLRTACAQAAAWRDAPGGLPPLTMSVNLSARQLVEGDLVGKVTEALESAGLDPSLLVLELTESMLVENPARVATILRALRALGVRLAIDDFGIGYSSLSYLRQFPFDILKIDRSFTEGIEDPERLPAIVRGLLDLGSTLELDIIAEGIEDDTQRRSLVNEGCELGQGFLFAHPLTSSAASELVLSRSTATPSTT